MGCTNSKPDLSNYCSLAEGDLYTIPSHCAIAGPLGDGYRVEACQALGAPGEWSRFDASGSCTYNSGTPNECSSGGGAPGFKTRCKREAFLANHFTCCGLNYEGSKDKSRCFEDDEQSKTCDPNYRGYTRPGCRKDMPGWSVEGIGPTELDAYPPRSYTHLWKYDSDTVVSSIDTNYRIALGQDNLDITPQEAVEGMTFARTMFSTLFNRYFVEDGFEISEPGKPGYSPFQVRILELAARYPAASGTYLKDNQCSGLTRQDIASNLTKIRFCGCHLSLTEYEKTSNIVGGINVQCDPVCNVSGSVRPTDGSYKTLICEQGVCIMDNITLELVNSRVGGITIDQVCSNCEKGCNCVISDINFNSNGGTIGGKIVIEQSCDSVRCYKTDEDGFPQEVDCDDSEDEQANEAGRKGLLRKEKEQTLIDNRAIKYALIGVGVLFVILFILAMIHVWKKA